MYVHHLYVATYMSKSVSARFEVEFSKRALPLQSLCIQSPISGMQRLNDFSFCCHGNTSRLAKLVHFSGMVLFGEVCECFVLCFGD